MCGDVWVYFFFFFSSRRRHTRLVSDWSSDVCSSDLLEREAVLGAERQDDRVLGGGRLQLEVEAAAEPLAEREAPRAVDPAPEGRVQHQLHPARLVKEALQHQRLLRRDNPEDLLRRLEILDHLARRGLGDPGDLTREP